MACFLGSLGCKCFLEHDTRLRGHITHQYAVITSSMCNGGKGLSMSDHRGGGGSTGPNGKSSPSMAAGLEPDSRCWMLGSCRNLHRAVLRPLASAHSAMFEAQYIDDRSSRDSCHDNRKQFIALWKGPGLWHPNAGNIHGHCDLDITWMCRNHGQSTCYHNGRPRSWAHCLFWALEQQCTVATGCCSNFIHPIQNVDIWPAHVPIGITWRCFSITHNWCCSHHDASVLRTSDPHGVALHE